LAILLSAASRDVPYSPKAGSCSGIFLNNTSKKKGKSKEGAGVKIPSLIDAAGHS
jgi:hypothetical protein